MQQSPLWDAMELSYAQLAKKLPVSYPTWWFIDVCGENPALEVISSSIIQPIPSPLKNFTMALRNDNNILCYRHKHLFFVTWHSANGQIEPFANSQSTFPTLSQKNPLHNHQNSFPTIYFNIIRLSTLTGNVRMVSSFQAPQQNCVRISYIPMRSTCPLHTIFDFIILIMFGKEYSLCSFHQPRVTISLLGPFSYAPSTYVLPPKWENKFHAHTKQEVKL